MVIEMTVLHDLNSDNIMTYLAYCAISTYSELISGYVINNATVYV